MKKKCTKCNKTKPIGEFAWRSHERRRRNSWCKTCVNARRMVLYHEDPQRNRAHTKDAIARNRSRAAAYLRDHPCRDCGEADIVVLDFHHVRGKKQNDVATLVSHGYSWAAVASEIAKCDVLCANCHRRRTSKKQRWLKVGG